ncbi:MAG: hypothetical protein IPM53_20420 [Anaerolineaceae bacterium]|nr:hypothetical protein [Anaerolineaceae bacterium]
MEALAIAQGSKVLPVAVAALFGLAVLAVEADALKLAAELVEHILQHPASRQNTRQRAEKLKAELISKLSPQQVNIIKEGANQWTLSDLVSRFLMA